MVFRFISLLSSIGRDLLFWRPKFEGSYEFGDLYENMRSELNKMKQKVANLTTQKRRLEMQQKRLEENIEEHEKQIEKARQENRDELANRARKKKQRKQAILEEVNDQIEEIDDLQNKMIEKKEWYQHRIQEFRTRRESLNARYQAEKESGDSGIFPKKLGDNRTSTKEINLAIERIREFEKSKDESFNLFEDAFDTEEIEQEVSSIEMTAEEEIDEEPVQDVQQESRNTGIKDDMNSDSKNDDR